MARFDRVELLIGSEKFERLKNASVIVFGVGGVGGYVAEALVRSGICNLTVVDGDTVSETNVNRQIIATAETIGQVKVEATKERLLAINPRANITPINTFYLPENAHSIDLSKYDYVVDAVDTVSAKLEIIMRAKNLGVPVISSMGTAGKLNPEKLCVGDVFSTQGCPLARVMRRELKKRGITKLKTVYSTEKMVEWEENSNLTEKKGKNRVAPPSMIFVPASAGLMIAKEVVLDIIDKKGE